MSVTATITDTTSCGTVAPSPVWRRWLVCVAPFVITGSVIAAILYKYPVNEIRRQLTGGDPLPAIPIALIGVIFTLLLVAWADQLVVRGACASTRYWHVLKAKAGSSLLDVFGYVAGHGAYAVWIGRFTRTRAGLAGGAMLYIAAADLLSVCTVASVSLFFTGDVVPHTVHIIAGSVATVLCLFLVLGPYQLFGGFTVFKPWALIPRWLGFAQVGLRIVHVVVWVCTTWIGARVFGLDIPLWAMGTYFPIIMLVGALPVNVAGFGAVQGAWLLLTDFAPGAQILAFQLVWTVFVAGAVVLRGLPFVRGFVREIDRAPETP